MMHKLFLYFFLSGVSLACCGTDTGRHLSASAVGGEHSLTVETADSLHSKAGGRQAKKPDTLTIAMVGDIMMGTTFPQRALPADDGKHLFNQVKEMLGRADLAVGNLEGTLCDGGESTKRVSRTSYAFRTPTSYSSLLAEAGFDYLSMANNHAFDFGKGGVESTEKALDKENIKYSGIAGRTEWAVVERNGVTFGLCAFGHNGYTMRHNDLALVKRVLATLKSKANVVVVSFHGGAEGSGKSRLPYGKEMFLGEDRGSLRDFAHFCVDAGADVVYGHGPHVVRCVEVYKDRFVAYSLGNFCTPFGMNLSGILGLAPVVQVKISAEGKFLKGKISSFVQHKGIGPREDKTHAAARQMKRLSEMDVPQSGAQIDNEGNITRK
ncbi:MAG: CapA family protein [Prevotella sp.]|nr:CapA family protein [Prevotella sp.]